MIDRIYLEDITPDDIERLYNGGKISFEVPDSDMMPTLRNFYDTVTVTKPNAKPKKNDVVLYRREDGSLLVRRVAYLNNDTYALSADGLKTTDYNISEKCIIGIMVRFSRKDKTISVDEKSYRFYVKVLPVVKVVYGFWLAAKKRVKGYIDLLIRR